MIPTLAEPGEVAPGQFGPTSVAPARRTISTAGIMSSAGMPSVMQKIVAIPAAAASMIASGAPPAGTKMQDVFAPVWRTASATVSKTGTVPSRATWPPLPGVIPATICVPYACIARLWNSPSRPVMPCTTSRVSGPTRTLMRPLPASAATAFAAASSSEVAVAKLRLLEQAAASAALVPTIRTIIGTSRSWTARASIRPRATSSPRVMPPKMLTRMASTFGSAEDDPHRRRDPVGPRTARRCRGSWRARRRPA